MFDTWHFARSNGQLADVARLPLGTIGGVQLNDWAQPLVGTSYVPMSGRLVPGDGQLPLAEILSAIEENSPGLDVCIEVFNEALERADRTQAVLAMARASSRLLA